MGNSNQQTTVRVMALRDRTLLHLEAEGKSTLNATLPRPTEPLHLAGLAQLLDALGMWLDQALDVVLHVSALDTSWWACLGEENGLPLSGTFYDFSIVVEDDHASAGFGEEG